MEIIRARIYDVLADGIQFENGAEGSIIGADVSGCGLGHSAISIVDSSPDVRSCRIHDTPYNAIYITKGARPRIEGGEIRNCRFGIALYDPETDPEVTGTRILDVAFYAISVGDAQGKISEVDISKWGTFADFAVYEGDDRLMGAIVLGGNATTVIDCCQIHGSREVAAHPVGIQSIGAARPTIRGGIVSGCVIGIEVKNPQTVFGSSSSALSGVESPQGPQITAIRIHDNLSGIWVKDDARATISDVDIAKFELPFGIVLDAKADATITNARFDHTPGTIRLRDSTAGPPPPPATLPPPGAPKVQEALAKLDALIGLTRVKQEIRKLANLAAVEKRRRVEGKPIVEPIPLHMVFTGNPGTGKTTVARLVGEIFAALTYLDKGHVVEPYRSELVGEYLGQTAPKVEKQVKKAEGGVLFIDEAYEYVPKGQPDPYGQEVISTLVKEMENKRDKFVVILAGYPEDMRRLIQSNAGLRSRFERYIEFEDYKADELTEIFLKMCRDNHFRLAEDAKQRAGEVIAEMHRLHGPQLGNARGVRKFFGTVREHQAERLVDNPDVDLMLLLPDDIPDAS